MNYINFCIAVVKYRLNLCFVVNLCVCIYVFAWVCVSEELQDNCHKTKNEIHNWFSLFAVVMSYKVTVKAELVITESLFLQEI